MLGLLATLLSCTGVPRSGFKAGFDQATEYFGDQFEFYYVPSAGWIADREFVKLSPRGQPSADAHRLAALLREGETRLTRIAVYCPSSAKMAAIVDNAIYLNRDRQMPHLELLYLGEASFGHTLHQPLEAVGARLYQSAPQ